MPLVKDVWVRLSAQGAEEVKAQLEEIKIVADEVGHSDPTIKVSVEDQKALLELAALRIQLAALKDDAGNITPALDNMVNRVQELGASADSPRVKLQALRDELRLVEERARQAAYGTQDLTQAWKKMDAEMLRADESVNRMSRSNDRLLNDMRRLRSEMKQSESDMGNAALGVLSKGWRGRVGGFFSNMLLRSLFSKDELATAAEDAAMSGGESGGGGLGALFGGGGIGSFLTSQGGLALIGGGIGSGLLGLIPGLLSAGTGLGAFAALAIPGITAVTGGLSNVSTAQAAITAAQQQLAIAKTATQKADARQALALARLQLRQATQGMTPQEIQAMHGIQGIQSQFTGMAAAFEPTAMPIFTELLKVAHDLLPNLLPLAKAVAPAISELLKEFDKFATSPGFKTFMKEIEHLAGPWLLTLGQTLGQLVVAVSKLLMSFANPQAMRTFRWLIDLISWALQGLAWIFRTVTNVIIETVHDWAKVFDTVRHAIAVALGAVLALLITFVANFGGWVKDVIRWGEHVALWFLELPGRIYHYLSGLAGHLLQIGYNAMMGLWHGLEHVGSQILSWLTNFGGSILSTLGSVLHLGSPSRATYQHGVWLGEGLALGMESTIPRITAAAGRMGRAALSGPGYSGMGAHAGGGAFVLRLDGNSGTGLDHVFFTWLQNLVRKHGGDPAMFQRKVAYR